MPLRLDWCSHEAARYAVKRWHYSHTMPVGKSVMIGVWEDEAYIGALIFGLGGGGAGDGRSYGLSRNFEVAELERVALSRHRTSVTRIIAIAVGMLRRQSPGLRLLVSYADPAAGHAGGIYQGGNWIYVGRTSDDWFMVDASGRRYHSRIARDHVQFGRKKTLSVEGMKKVIAPGKHKYLYPLDAEMKARVAPLARPYPKRAGSIAVDAPVVHTGEGGSIPTPALQTTGGSDAAPA